jgi:hypothetical protein
MLNTNPVPAYFIFRPGFQKILAKWVKEQPESEAALGCGG